MWPLAQTAPVDPTLAGIATIIVAVSTFVLGLVGLLIGQRRQNAQRQLGLADEQWKLIAQLLLDRENDRKADPSSPDSGGNP